MLVSIGMPIKPLWCNSDFGNLLYMGFYWGRQPGTIRTIKRISRNLKMVLKKLRWVVEQYRYIEFDNVLLIVAGRLCRVLICDTGIRVFYLQATKTKRYRQTLTNWRCTGGIQSHNDGLEVALYSAGGYLNPSSNYLGVNDVKVDGENLLPLDWG
jgi:hypothetical protein